MPDGKRIPPNAATFYMNSADFSGIKFILPETKKQLFAKMEARFKDAPPVQLAGRLRGQHPAE